MKQMLFVVAVVVVATTAQAEVLFKASTQVDCQKNAFGSGYAACKPIPREGRSVTFKPQALSSTNLAFVKSLPVRNKLTYGFPCTSAQVLNAYFSYDGMKQKLDFKQTGKSLTQYVRYDSTSSYELRMNEENDLFPMVNGDCRIEVNANVSFPEVAPLQWYASRLKLDAQQQLGLLAQADSAQTLPGKYAVLKALPIILGSMVQSKQFEESLLKSEADGLAAMANRTADQQARLDGLQLPGGLLETIAAEIAQLTTLKADVAEGLLNTAPCQDGAGFSENECLAQVQAVVGNVKGHIAATKAEITALGQFLNAESQRLQGVENALADQLKTLATQILN